MLDPENECETGWLELKVAESLKSGGMDVRIEPSQHQWIQLHEPRVPVYFLVEWSQGFSIINGWRHLELSKRITEKDMERMSFMNKVFVEWEFDQLADLLIYVTKRGYRR